MLEDEGKGFISPDGVDRIDLSEFRIYRRLEEAVQEEEAAAQEQMLEEAERLEGTQLFEELAAQEVVVQEERPQEDDEPQEEPPSTEQLLGELDRLQELAARRREDLRPTQRVIYDPYNESFNSGRDVQPDGVPEMPAAADYKFDSFRRKK